MTDEARFYKGVGKEFDSHESVNHSDKEYAYDEVTTNTVPVRSATWQRRVHIPLRSQIRHRSVSLVGSHSERSEFEVATQLALSLIESTRWDYAVPHQQCFVMPSNLQFAQTAFCIVMALSALVTQPPQRRHSDVCHELIFRQSEGWLESIRREDTSVFSRCRLIGCKSFL